MLGQLSWEDEEADAMRYTAEIQKKDTSIEELSIRIPPDNKQ